MEKSKKRTIIQTIVCIGLLCAIWGGYFLTIHYGTGRILEIKEDDFSWIYQIDEVKNESNVVKISGFAFQTGQTSLNGNYEIVLRNVENDKMLFPKMQYEERVEVKEYFNLAHECTKSGFIASINTNKLGDVKTKYEILLRVKGERTSYRTGMYIVNDEAMMMLPESTPLLNVEGTVIEDVVMKGVLQVQNPQVGVYIYQYEDDLYWITDNLYVFDENNDIFMRCQMLVIGDENSDTYSEWVGKGFWFSKNELSDVNTGEYRVARFHLPSEYPIEKIKVGEREVEWKWVEYFRPRYEWN